ncbi:MAG: preprotein translocase subunit SecG, partial [Planctomycetota bacterium]
VLVQRGRGGGLAGALGGPGGQSAFGSKAGDTFTLITVVTAAIWAFVCAFTMWLLGTHTPSLPSNTPGMAAGPGDEEVADEFLPPTDDVLGGLEGLLGSGDAEDEGESSDAADAMELTPAETGATEEASAPDTAPEDAAPSTTDDSTAADATVEGDATDGDDAAEEPSAEDN